MPVPVLHTPLLSSSYLAEWEEAEHRVTTASQPVLAWGLLWLPQEDIPVLLMNYVTF